MLVHEHILGKTLYTKTEGRDPGLGSSVLNFQLLSLQAFSHHYQKQFSGPYKISTLLEIIWKNWNS